MALPSVDPVELAGDVALGAAADFAGGLALGGAPGDVGAGAGAAAHLGERDRVDGAVQRPVAWARSGLGEAADPLQGLIQAPVYLFVRVRRSQRNGHPDGDP